MKDIILKLTAPLRLSTVFTGIGDLRWADKIKMIIAYPFVLITWYFYFMWKK